jgi:hypothetical protein
VGPCSFCMGDAEFEGFRCCFAFRTGWCRAGCCVQVGAFIRPPAGSLGVGIATGLRVALQVSFAVSPKIVSELIWKVASKWGHSLECHHNKE